MELARYAINNTIFTNKQTNMNIPLNFCYVIKKYGTVLYATQYFLHRIYGCTYVRYVCTKISSLYDFV